MKNKSKRKKIKQQKKRVQPSVNWPKEWLYLNEKEITPEDFLKVFPEGGPLELQVWKEAGVIEVELPCGKSIDMEWGEPDLGEETGNAFLEGKNTKALYYVTVVPESFEETRTAMKTITEMLGGGFFGDNKDFQPQIYKKKNSPSLSVET